jgi:hypothetical protein
MMERLVKTFIHATKKRKEVATRFVKRYETQRCAIVMKDILLMQMESTVTKSHHANLLTTEDVHKHVPTTAQKLSVHVQHLTTSLERMENLATRFIHVTNQTMLDVLTNVRKMEEMPHVVVPKDVN